MCLAIPMKITELHEKTAVGEADGARKEIRIDFIPDLTIGEYVMVHAGFALQKVTESDARETAQLMRELQELSTQ